MYRMRREHHHRTGDAWCIYPMYDFAHGYSDAIEGVTHSICTLEFEDHRPLYDWFLDQEPFDPRPEQIEFAKLNPTYTITSKRKLKQLVARQPRDGLGRSADADARGAAAARVHARGDPGLLRAHRRLQAKQRRRRRPARARGSRGPQRALPPRHGRRPAAAGRSRELPRGPARRRSRLHGFRTTRREAAGRFRFGRVVYIDRDDFAEVPPKGWFRLTPGRRSAPAPRVHHQVRARGQRRRRRGRRAPLHVGPASRAAATPATVAR